MSFVSGGRADIVTALSTVDNVQGFERRPSAPNTGDGWPVLGALDRAAGLSFEVTWRVLILLPQDEEAADVWIEGHVDDLVDALEPVGFIDRIEPAITTIGKVDQMVLQITIRSE